MKADRERDISQEEPKVGVFICDCGENIGGVIDVETPVQTCREIYPMWPWPKPKDMAAAGLSMENIRQTIEEEQLNRVVIGGCSPRTHLAKFQDLLGKAGLNKYLVEIANIRDQATWVHSGKTGRSNG